MGRKAGVILSALFYLAMLALTIGSQIRYQNALAPVTVGNPSMSTRLADGVSVSYVTLPPQLAGKPVYCLERVERNGRIRLLAREVREIEYGEPDAEENVTVISGLSSMDVVILDGNESVTDGKEVKVLNEEALPSWWK